MDFYSFLQKLYSEITNKYALLAQLDNLKIGGQVNRLDSTKHGDGAVWVCIHEWDYKGNIYYVAIFGNWRLGDKNQLTSYSKAQTFTTEFYKQEKEAQLNAQAKLDEEKREKHKSCREKWEPYFANLSPDTHTHNYLVDKRITSNFHARIDLNNVLYVPAWNADGAFIGAQRIFLDPESNKYEKRFTFGIELLGSFCPFGDVRNAEYIYICEGFATAASVYMAMKHNPKVAVVAVWNTSNLLEGAKAIRRINGGSYLIFAADRDIKDDPRWHQIGERKAKAAANKLSNAVVRVVDFSVDNKEWSDFNDLHMFEGLDKVCKQLTVDISDFIEIIPLGFNANNYYYFSTARKQILEFGKSDHNAQNLMLNAPRKYWGDRFGYTIKADMTPTNSPDWHRVVEELGKRIIKAGPFNFSKVRGLGAWLENDDIIVNLGDKLFYKNQFFPLFNHGIETDHFYEAGSLLKMDFERPLSDYDCSKFVEAFRYLKYKNKSDYILLLGWLFSSQVFAALPWRPHLWITGEKGSGKSTVLNYVHSCLKFSVLIQDSTVSGIRQRIGNNAVSIINDESEPNNDKDRERLAELLTLARQCSTRSSYEVLRGSAGGKALSYNTNANFFMGSIQIARMNGADTSRFFVVEMESVEGQTHEEFVRLDNAMNDIIPLVDGLFVRAVRMFPALLKNIEKCKTVIKNKKIESRQADQLAPIIAGYHAFFSAGEISEDFITETIQALNFEQSDYVKANEDNDSDKCLGHIFELQAFGAMMTVGQIFESYLAAQPAKRDDYDRLLGLYGIKMDIQNQEFFIPVNSGPLKNALEKNSTYSDYVNILKRHKRFKRTESKKINGLTARGIILHYST